MDNTTEVCGAVTKQCLTARLVGCQEMPARHDEGDHIRAVQSYLLANLTEGMFADYDNAHLQPVL